MKNRKNTPPKESLSQTEQSPAALRLRIWLIAGTLPGWARLSAENFLSAQMAGALIADETILSKISLPEQPR